MGLLLLATACTDAPCRVDASRPVFMTRRDSELGDGFWWRLGVADGGLLIRAWGGDGAHVDVWRCY